MNLKKKGEKMKKNLREIKKFMAKNYGKKCKQYNPFCSICIMWHSYHTMKEGIEIAIEK